MKRIWFNHWFSSVYYIIELIKNNKDDFYIIGSNGNKEAAYMNVCDEWYQEPDLEDEQYVEFCLDFCRKHSVDVFVPRRKMLAVSRNKSRFEEIGVRIMADDYEKISALSSKSGTYELLKKYGLGDIPEYYTITDAAGFEKAYYKLKENYERVCFKYDNDEGASSFRCVEENVLTGIDAVFRKRGTAEDVIKALSEAGTVSPIIVMPYLPGDEVSVDCLKTSSGTVMIPRYKNWTRIEKIHYDDYILSVCREFLEITRLENPCNIQFKYLDDTPYFLEVNTRMSGGVHMTALASGINIPYIAVNKLLGTEKTWTENREDKLVTHVEKPLVLK